MHQSIICLLKVFPALKVLCNVQAKTLLLKRSPFRSLEALLSLFDDFAEGTGVMYVRAQRQPLRGDLVSHVVDGCKDVQDEETGKTLRAYLGQTYLFHKAFKCVSCQAFQCFPKAEKPAYLTLFSQGGND